MNRLFENIPTAVVGLILVAAVVLAIVRLIKDKKSGKRISGCGGNCESCVLYESCEKQTSEDI